MSAVEISFESPPVVEVVVGVAFDGLEPDPWPLLNAFWAERARSKFPRLEPQQAYVPTVEEFPVASLTLDLQFHIGAPPTRLWAITRDGQEVLQLQPGWFACNWRQVQPDQTYDRWSQRRAAFAKWFQLLDDFASDEGGDRPRITQCEVTYVNHIQSGGVWKQHADFPKVFEVQFGASPSHELERVSGQAAFKLEQNGQPRGRLHAKIVPAFGRDGKMPLYVLEMAARGRPDGPGLDGALAFLDVARAAINDGFVNLTTAAMHEEWGRKQ